MCSCVYMYAYVHVGHRATSNVTIHQAQSFLFFPDSDWNKPNKPDWLVWAGDPGSSTAPLPLTALLSRSHLRSPGQNELLS